MDTNAHHARAARFARWLAIVALVYTAFVVYGSLVPFDYQPRSLDAALARFSRIPFLQLGVDRRSDWVANFLLFVPISALWFGAATHVLTSGAARVLVSILVLGLCLGLGIGIEFIQIYFPARTVSQNDVFAQAFGALCGVVVWTAGRARFSRAYDAWNAAASVHGRLTTFLWYYVIFLVIYSVLPLDLTISPGELYQKWKLGRIELNPFRFDAGQWAKTLADIATDSLTWVPIAVLVYLRVSTRAIAIAAVVGLAAAFVEFAQLFVFSRYSDLRDVLVAMVSALPVALVMRKFASKRRQTSLSGHTRLLDGRAPTRGTGTMLSICGCWLMLLAGLYWYPYEFSFSVEAARAGIESLFSVPLGSYYTGSEYNALSQALRRIFLFAPFGLVFALYGRSLWLALLFGALANLMLECVQLFQAHKYFDLGDLLFVCIGIGGAHVAARRVIGAESPASVEPPRSQTSETSSRLPALLLSFLVLPFIGGAIVAMATTLPSVPYNVKELFDADIAPWLVGFRLNLVAVMLCAGSVVVVHWVRQYFGVRALSAPALFALPLVLVSWWLLHFTVPNEALHDIVGSPVLAWPWHFEELARFCGLALPIVLVQIAIAWSLTQSPETRFVRSKAILLVAVAIGIGHVVVVELTDTDNLVELMRDGGTLYSSVAVGLWIVVLFGALHRLAHDLFRVSGARQFASILLYLLSVPMGFTLVLIAQEPALHKYGQTFSGLQFLLSPDRQNLLPYDQLLLRYALVHTAVLIGGLVACWPLYARTAQRLSRGGAQNRADARASSHALRGCYLLLRLPPATVAQLGHSANVSEVSEKVIIDQVVGQLVSRLERAPQELGGTLRPARSADEASFERIEFWLEPQCLALLGGDPETAGRRVEAALIVALAEPATL